MPVSAKRWVARSARAAARRCLARPNDRGAERALGAHDDDGVGHLSYPGDGDFQQAPALPIAQRELVRAEATCLAARDDDRG